MDAIFICTWFVCSLIVCLVFALLIKPMIVLSMSQILLQFIYFEEACPIATDKGILQHFCSTDTIFYMHKYKRICALACFVPVECVIPVNVDDMVNLSAKWKEFQFLKEL